MRRRLWFNDVCLSDYGLWISGDYTEAMAEPLGEGVHIPGRSGDYWIDEGSYQNLSLEYPAFLVGDLRELQRRLRSLRQIVGGARGYVRIEDDYHPDEYRMGRYVAGLGEKISIYRGASEFSLVFDCKPQRYLKSALRPIVLADEAQANAPGDLVTDNPAELRNPTGREARPMLRLFYADEDREMVLRFGDTVITCRPCGHYCIGIDMEARTCYYNGENLSRYVSITEGGAIAMDYPAIGEKAVIERAENVRAVQVYPRWWWL